MKLRELLQQLEKVQEKIGSSKAYICGGTPRDRYLKHLENISDLDLTTGDKSVQYLAQEFGAELTKKYNVTRRSHDDGHSSVYIGSFKMDFSSNFNVPNIDSILREQGIPNPSEMQKEMFSRDFTCNALLLSLDLKELSDPTKLGFKDIKDRKIRTCLAPEITLTTNKNRVIRAIYLASKLDFDIDDTIVNYVSKNPGSVKIASEKALAEKLNEAFNRDGDKAAYYISKMNLWGEIPITEVVQPYYMKQSSMPKRAYFQGGGGVNEPTPGKKKYKSDPAIVNQTRFKEPFYRNYDIYDIPGFEHIGPGAGWHSMQKYKTVSEFLDAKRKKMRDKYKADDSWIQPNGEITKENPIKTRARLLSKIVKTAQRNYDLGKGLYENMDKYKSVENFRNDVHSIDFPVDEQIGSGSFMFNEETVQPLLYLGPEGPPGDMSPYIPGAPNLGDEQVYPHSAEIGGEATFPWPDAEGKLPSDQFDFSRDYTDEFDYKNSTLSEEDLERLMDKYLSPSPTHGLFGLPDGVDLPDEDLGDPTDINPDYGSIGPESLIYEDKWNI